MMEVAPPAGIIHRYFDRLPVSGATPVVTLGEGGTPLLPSDGLSEEVGARVWLKHEGVNPTGSFKDRGMTLAISKACEEGAEAVVCASTGNTSASAAAYAARAGLACAVVVPERGVPEGKLAQALAHGAVVLEIDGNFDRALELTRETARAQRVTVVNSVNPYRIEGQKTAALEIVEDLDRAPDIHVMPVGNAGNITAYWRGYREAANAGSTRSTPAMYGCQAEGADPIVRGSSIAEPDTMAAAIRIGNPASWSGASQAAARSGGEILAVSDAEIVAAFRSLASDGLFVELASAASVAGLRRLHRRGLVPEGATVVCVLTGHGLKDPGAARSIGRPPRRVHADGEAILAALDQA
jgi:threonine synthase